MPTLREHLTALRRLLEQTGTVGVCPAGQVWNPLTNTCEVAVGGPVLFRGRGRHGHGHGGHGPEGGHGGHGGGGHGGR